MEIFYFTALTIGLADAANQHTFEVANGLAALGHRVRLFVAGPEQPLSRERHENFHIHFVPALKTRSVALNAVSYYLALPWATWRYLWRYRPDIIYSRLNFLDWLAVAPLKLFFRFNFVGEINGIRSLEAASSPLRHRLIGLGERLSLRLCRQAIGVTDELCHWAQQTGRLRPEQTATIGNGVNDQLFQPIDRQVALQRLGLDPDCRYLGFVGSLKAWHDLGTPIAALPLILAQAPAARILVVGDGPLRPQWEALASKLGVAESVIWLGRVKVDDVPHYINACEICLAPFNLGRNSVTGVSPIKIFEYMSCGRPFVTTAIGTAYDDQVKGWGAGLLVPPQAPEPFATAVLELLADEARRCELGQAGREQVERQFAWSSIARRTAEFLQQGLQGKV